MIKVLIIVIMFLISIIDIKTMEIPNILLLIMLILSVFIHNDNIGFKNILSSALFIYPFFILILLEEIIKKEIIGFGDIKYIAILGFLVNKTDFNFLIFIYTKIYFFSFIYIIFLYIVFFIRTKNIKKSYYLLLKREYIAFSPYITLAFIKVIYEL